MFIFGGGEEVSGKFILKKKKKKVDDVRRHIQIGKMFFFVCLCILIFVSILKTTEEALLFWDGDLYCFYVLIYCNTFIYFVIYFLPFFSWLLFIYLFIYYPIPSPALLLPSFLGFLPVLHHNKKKAYFLSFLLLVVIVD